MKVKMLDLQYQYQSIKNEIDMAISDVLSEAGFIGGPRVKSFESNFASFCNANYCIGVGNGTDALEIAIESLNLPAGSEIIVPGNSFIASAESVTRNGHKVVFCDVDPDTYVIGKKQVSEVFTKKTKAIIAVHLYGHPARMGELLEFAREKNIFLIEDCAQAHGALIDTQKIGSIGDVAAFSFYPGKNLGAYGDAGAIITNNAVIANQCRLIANHGRLDKYDHKIEGRNSRLDSLQAAILDVKLKHLDRWAEKRRSIAYRYTKRLGGRNEVVCPKIDKNVDPVFHLYVIRTEARDDLKEYLEQKGIQVGIHYPTALPNLMAYSYLGVDTSHMLYTKYEKQLLSLPMGEHLNTDDVDYVCEMIDDFFSKR